MNKLYDLKMKRKGKNEENVSTLQEREQECIQTFKEKYNFKIVKRSK